MDGEKPPTISQLLKGLVTLFWTDRAPMLLSVFALVLGIGQGWSVIWTHHIVPYDPATAVLTATLVALIWTAYYANYSIRDARVRAIEEAARRADARVAVLAGVASELENVDSWAEAASSSLYHVRIPRIQHIMLGVALNNFALLKHEEVALLSSIAVNISLIESGLAKLSGEISKAFTDPTLVNVATIEQAAPGQVNAIRRDIRAARANFLLAVKMLSPEMYPLTKWGKAEAELGETV